MLEYDYADKSVFITGGSSGLGFACAEHFCGAGAKVLIADIDDESTRRAELLLKKNKGEILSAKCDVTDAKSVSQSVRKGVDAFGKIDIAINSAGVASQLAFIEDSSETNFDHLIGVNLKGIWLSMRAEIRQMLDQGGGCIINMASALHDRVFAGGAAYVSSKFAVEGLTRTAAIENAQRGIRINGLCPGIAATKITLDATPPDMHEELANIHPMRRLARVDEVARAAMWLASDHSSFTTGAMLAVDGGWNAQ